MKKEISLFTRKFSLPNSLLDNSCSPPVAKNKIQVNINELCHFMYFDSVGKQPPIINPLFLLYEDLLTADNDLRFSGNGPGSHKEATIALSNMLGKAMCKWFLSKYADMVYFAHIDHMLDKTVEYSSSKGRIIIKRSSTGDAPDYFCANSSKFPYVAEAKGRKSSISFTGKSFSTWRKQFKRVRAKEVGNNKPSYRLKGYIVATRYTNEKHKRTKSALYVEDPNTPGVKDYDDDIKKAIGNEIVLNHYANILGKFDLLEYSNSLKNNLILDGPEVRVGIWQSDYMKGKEFVGFLTPIYWDYKFPESYGREQHLKDGSIISKNYMKDPLLYFFGLEKGVFEKVLKICREGRDHLSQLENFNFDVDNSPETMVILKDGTISSSPEYMEFSRLAFL